MSHPCTSLGSLSRRLASLLTIAAGLSALVSSCGQVQWLDQTYSATAAVASTAVLTAAVTRAALSRHRGRSNQNPANTLKNAAIATKMTKSVLITMRSRPGVPNHHSARRAKNDRSVRALHAGE